MKLYVSGPISIVGPPTYNKPAFNNAAIQLRVAGFSAVNPFDLDDEPINSLSWEEYMRRDLRALLDCDGVATLDGWQDSRGAGIEVDLAVKLGMPVDMVGGWLGNAAEAAAAAAMHPRVSPEYMREQFDTAMRAWDGEGVVWVDEEELASGSVVWPSDKSYEVHEPIEESVALEAHKLVNGQRQDDYGHPLDNFTQTGQMWAAILGVPEVTAEQVGLMMVAAKLSRQCHRPKRDNLTDIAGYATTVDMVGRERERRAA